jgi:hypothetical protein
VARPSKWLPKPAPPSSVIAAARHHVVGVAAAALRDEPSRLAELLPSGTSRCSRGDAEPTMLAHARTWSHQRARLLDGIRNCPRPSLVITTTLCIMCIIVIIMML